MRIVLAGRSLIPSLFLTPVSTLYYMQNMTKVKKEYLVLVLGAVMSIFVFFGVGAGSLCGITGFVYPAFKSFQAIESKMKGDDQQWLIYWVVYGFFSVIETFSDFLLYWIPFYYAFKVRANRFMSLAWTVSLVLTLTLRPLLFIFKLAFLLWMMLPQTMGAMFLYESFLRDFLKKNESKIDTALKDAKKTSSSMANNTSTSVTDATSSEVKKDT